MMSSEVKTGLLFQKTLSMPHANFAEINKQLGLLPGFQGLNDLVNSTDPEDELVGYHTTPLDRVCRDAEVVAEDVVLFFNRESEKKPKNRYCKTMRRTVKELSDRHDILFQSMITRLQVDDCSLFVTFAGVVDEIFEDGQINWGRVVAVYTFAARLADSFIKDNKPDAARKIATYTGRYVGKKLGKWIIENGGWDGFADFFPEQGLVEDKLWKGLVFAAVGLGALAIVAH